ncbi:response regulator [Fulvivirgaceae bacterium PWU4]|uniref:histidine kinase n=1 Tax=Chryseosolibacter histidini TaxID=2782349 RepID=A0AAP2GTH9_9BACT|nr:two-component regulator propeller domain-containing protein [Chryseosolibacter histidini]MBT1701587.1 response regulator [Chryseosolibacter histidini]
MKHLIRTSLLVLYACLWHCGIKVFAQQHDLNFDHIGVEQGLSQSTVLAITQDIEGFMWFGTREGLNKYDARRVTVYRNDPSHKGSVSENSIYSLLTDSRGRVWVGTRNGLNQYDASTDSFRRYYPDQISSESQTNNTVTAILEDRNGNLWVGTRKGLKLMVEKDSVSFIQFVNQPNNSNSLVNDDIHALYQDSDGAIWIGAAHGFSRLVYNGPKDFTFTSFSMPESTDLSNKGYWVNAFAEDKSGRLLIGGERDGLLVLDRHTLKFAENPVRGTQLDGKAVRSILKDPKGGFWIGTIGGLYVVNEDFTSIRQFRNIHDNPNTISDNSIRSLYCDRQGSYWIGTFHGGVNIYSALSKQFRHLKPRSDNQKFRFKIASALTTDRDQNFWIGTEGNGLLFVDKRLNLKTHFKHDAGNTNSLSHDNIKCLLLEEGEGIWIGTIKGLDYYDFKRKKFTHYKHDRDNVHSMPDDVIYDLLKDGDGDLWIATYRGGIVKLDTKKGVAREVYTHQADKPQSVSSEGITRLFMDSKQNLWAGTMSGLNRKKADGTFIRFTHNPAEATSISGDYITSLYEDSQHRFWVGTRGTGLNLLEADGKTWRHFTTTDGLPGNTIYGIQEDGRGYLWLSTENGLSRFDAVKITFKNFNSSDGLVCKEFNFNSHHKDGTGHLYFGGYNGVVYFHPDSINHNMMVPDVAFTKMRLFNKEIRPGDDVELLPNHVNHQGQIEFRYDQNIFSVEFAVLNYINAQKNQFAYRLAGFESDWNIVNEPVATYMNLSPGRYTLLVKGSNNDGIWNDTPRSLAIVVFPPPWKTWWAYMGYVATFLLLLYAWARLNKKRVRLEHDLALEHLEKVKQHELHQAKLNFFTNIAHEIRTPVTLMAGPLDHVMENHPHDAVLRKELMLVKTNSDRLMRLLNQLLDFQKQETGNVKLKVSKGDITAFIREMIYSFREYAESRNVSLQFKTETEPIYLWFDRDELSKVFFNLLVNALKYTPGGGHVNILVSCQGEDTGTPSVQIIIEDNGLGIAAEHLEKIFHRFYQAENTGIQEAGFGIGLALTKGIIDLHRGSIKVESREATPSLSGFTRFTITLPATNEHFGKEQILSEPESDGLMLAVDDVTDETAVAKDKKETGEKPLILLVEDNEDIRRYIRDILLPSYDVIESTNGFDGYEIAAERLPNLIVSDVMMPRMNGIDLVRKLKTDMRTNHIPVILLTARGTLNHQVEGLEIGADDYLTKPFNTSLLTIKIKNHLQVREKLKEKYSRIVTLQPQHQEVQDPDDRFLQRLMTILEENIMDADFNVSGLVKEIGMSRPVLFRKTKMLTGLSVIDLIRNVRLKKAEMLLRQKKLSISEVAFTVGFSDPKYFSKSFRNQFGKPPSQYLEELE